VPDVEIRDNPQARRYEAVVDGQVVGIAQYRSASGRVIFTHTQVDDAAEGQGIGSRLVARALDDVRRRGLRATLYCPFISAYVRRHPEYADIVDTRPSQAET